VRDGLITPMPSRNDPMLRNRSLTEFMVSGRLIGFEVLSIWIPDALHFRDKADLQPLGLSEVLASEHSLSIIRDPIESIARGSQAYEAVFSSRYQGNGAAGADQTFRDSLGAGRRFSKLRHFTPS
jgi:hypothetical protein